MDTNSPSPHQSDRYTIGTAQKPRRLYLWLAIVVVLIAGAAFFFNYVNNMRQAAITNLFATMKPPPAPISPAIATVTAVPQYLSGIGTLAAVHQVTLSPEIGGLVVKISFEAGQTVQAGDALIQLNDKPDRGDLANYQAQAKLAQLNLGRAQSLVKRQFETQVNVDQQQSNLDVAEGNIAKTQALIAQKLVRAPFSGQLGLRQVELGQYLQAGAPIVTLTDLSTLYVNFTLPEQARSKLVIGQEVQLKVDAYPGRAFTGKLTAIEPQINANTRNMSVQATMANADHALLPGMFANASIVLPPQPDVLILPETAVDYSLYGDSVYLVSEAAAGADGKTHLKVTQTFVKTGERHDGTVSILSGLKPGDKVASSGQVKLHTGSEVILSDSNALVKPAVTPTE
jgi:multidrug efflux system membrane fusion protein